MLLRDVQAYDSDVLHLSIPIASMKFTKLILLLPTLPVNKNINYFFLSTCTLKREFFMRENLSGGVHLLNPHKFQTEKICVI